MLNKPVSFARVAGDLSRSEGEWRLTELNGGNSTRVSYVADVNYHTMLPGFVLRSHLQGQMVRDIILTQVSTTLERKA